MGATTRQRVGVRQLQQLHRADKKIVVLSVYDALMARLADEAGVHILLVGDSLGMTLLGYETTVPVTLADSLHHTAAVVRGRKTAMVVADMPFLSYQVSVEDAILNAGRYLQEAGADGVKLEGGGWLAPTVERLVQIGVPVLGHIGILPQTILAEGGYRVHGRSAEEAAELKKDARRLQDAGVFGVVLEGLPVDLSGEITEMLDVPTIGIGGGPKCSGQVQVMHDVLGMLPDFRPKHARHFAKLAPQIAAAFEDYTRAVQEGEFPGEENSFR